MTINSNGVEFFAKNICFSSDSQFLLSCSSGSIINLWDIKTGKSVQLYKGHTDFVNVALFFGNNIIISGSQDKTIKLWGQISGNVLKTFECISPIVCLAVNPKTSNFITGYLSLMIWEDVGNLEKNIDDAFQPKVLKTEEDESADFICKMIISLGEENNFSCKKMTFDETCKLNKYQEVFLLEKGGLMQKSSKQDENEHIDLFLKENNDVLDENNIEIEFDTKTGVKIFPPRKKKKEKCNLF